MNERGEGIDELLNLIDKIAALSEENDLDESEPSDVTPESEAAVDRLMATFFPAGVPTHPAQELVDDQFAAIVSANLGDLSENLVSARGIGAQAPTRDLVVPDLAKFGYDPHIELEVDIPAEGDA